MSKIITRFAPSPTGYLHIGSARTALFNWLFAKHYGGQFFLRIEDTDRERSTQGAVNAIFKSMHWLGLDWDGEAVFQFARAARHAEVAEQLLKDGNAYYCYCSPEELEAMRAEAKAQGKPMGYNGMWRDRDPKEAPKDRKPVVRFKAPIEGETVIHDRVQGTVTVNHSQLDDMVLLRADGTPTYMLSVVVDDHDMDITHIIRGDDHFTNAFRQSQLYQAMGWDIPEFAHIPLIHGPDGAKLSKRHGALGADEYKDMGFLPEAMRNYLLRLGWGHKDEEIIPTTRAIELFDLGGIGRAPARFDIVKLTSLNAHYMKEMDNAELLTNIRPFLEKLDHTLSDMSTKRLLKGMDGLKQRAKTLVELADMAQFYITPLAPDEKAMPHINEKFKDLVLKILSILEKETSFDHTHLEQLFRGLAEEWQVKLGELAQVLRISLTGRTISPSMFEVMEVLGKDEVIARLKAIAV